MRRLLLVFGFFVLSGCDSELKLVVLTPSQVATAVNRNYKFSVSAGVSCGKKRDKVSCYDRYGVSPDAEGNAPVAVGLYHDYAHGEFELLGLVETGSCSERLNCIYRGLIKFDLTQLGPSPKIVTAKLKYEGSFDKNSDVTTWADDASCIASIGTVQSPWGGFDLPAEFFGNSTTGGTGLSTGIEVTQIVRNWATGSSPTNGFMLIGPNEAIKNDDDTCVVTLSNIRLEVQINIAGN
jgi:hypothetical protein